MAIDCIYQLNEYQKEIRMIQVEGFDIWQHKFMYAKIVTAEKRSFNFEDKIPFDFIDKKVCPKYMILTHSDHIYKQFKMYSQVLL